jgi:hypothetical protein
LVSDDPIGRLQRDVDRLLDHDVLSRLQRADGQLDMRCGGRRDRQRVDARVGEHSVEVGRVTTRTTGLGQPASRRVPRAHDDAQLRELPQARDRPRVDIRDHPGADQRETDLRLRAHRRHLARTPRPSDAAVTVTINAAAS